MDVEELLIYAEERERLERERIQAQLDITALQTCWILNAFRGKDADPLTPDDLLGRKEKPKPTTKAEYEEIKRLTGGE